MNRKVLLPQQQIIILRAPWNLGLIKRRHDILSWFVLFCSESDDAFFLPTKTHFLPTTDFDSLLLNEGGRICKKCHSKLHYRFDDIQVSLRLFSFSLITCKQCKVIKASLMLRRFFQLLLSSLRKRLSKIDCGKKWIFLAKWFIHLSPGQSPSCLWKR